MVDLRGFPVSDEFNSDRQTFCVILDRNEIFDIPKYWFSEIGHVTPEDMEMSEITLRIEWKHFQKPAGPVSGRSCPLKSRHLGFGHHGTFFQSLGKFEKWEIEKKCWHCRANFFWADGRGLSMRSIGGLVVALCPENVQVLREQFACATFLSPDISFSTLCFLDCRDPGFAPRNEERWPCPG